MGRSQQRGLDEEGDQVRRSRSTRALLPRICQLHLGRSLQKRVLERRVETFEMSHLLNGSIRNAPNLTCTHMSRFCKPTA